MAAWKEVHPWVAEGKGQLRFGTGLPNADDWAKNRDNVQLIEELGFDSAMTGDHPSGSLDCWTRLAFYAAVTRKIRLVSVSCVYYRSPQLLVRHATDIDRLSGGRLVLGLGAGWAKGDFDYLGIPFPSDAERVRYLGETIRTIQQLWSDPPTVTSNLLGYSFSDRVKIQPVQEPRLPLLVAGAGPKILRQAVECGDMMQLEVLKAPTAASVRAKLDYVRRCCDESGRPVHSLIRSHFTNTVILAPSKDEAERRLNALPSVFRDSGYFQPMTPRDLIAYYRPLIDAGANYLYFDPFGSFDAIPLFANTVMPELRDYYASTLA